MEFSELGKDAQNTGFEKDKLINIAKASTEVHCDIKAHDRITRMHIANRNKGIEENKYDWATAEAMAWGSLVMEGFNVRLIGEDVERGTFS